MGENEKRLARHLGGQEAKPEKRKIIQSRNPNDWYKDMVGKVIEIKMYGTFGIVDMQDRFISFYDLSEVIN